MQNGQALEDCIVRATAIASRWLPPSPRAIGLHSAHASQHVQSMRPGDDVVSDTQAPAETTPDHVLVANNGSTSTDAVAARPIETHWSRILYQDLLTPDACDETPGRGAIAEREALPSLDRVTGYLRRRAGSRHRGEAVTLSTADGYPIAAMRYAVSGPARAMLVVAGAVGVPQRFYQRFAEFAASVGYSTMTLDYRGVGLSAPRTLEGFKMDYFDWGRLDLAAAVAAMSRPDVPLYVIGHSFGGHAFGLLPNHAKVRAFYTFGTGAGWHGWMPFFERIKVFAMWNILGPLLTGWHGYLSWSVLGLGEDLPLDFYRRWKHWCRYPNYFFGDPSMRYLARDFDRVRAPMMAANSIDDRWAPPQSRDAFMAGYRNATRHTLDIDPTRIGVRAIGHMGYFRPDAMPLWEAALAWLDARPKPRAAVS
jgi:predicted alpha/beta hydrolase